MKHALKKNKTVISCAHERKHTRLLLLLSLLTLRRIQVKTSELRVGADPGHEYKKKLTKIK